MTQGRNKNSYYNEYFLRGLPHLCKKAPHPGNIATLNIYSKYEPDLFAISDKHPVPEEIDTLVPCGASIAVIDRSIKEQGPKGRVPVIQSRPLGNDADSAMTPRLSGRTQMNLLDNQAKVSSGGMQKRMKYFETPELRSTTAGTTFSPRLTSPSDNLCNAGLLPSSINKTFSSEIEHVCSPFARADGNYSRDVDSADVISGSIPTASSGFHQNTILEQLLRIQLLANGINQGAGSSERSPLNNEVPSYLFECSQPGRVRRVPDNNIEASNVSLQDMIRKAVLMGAMIGYMSRRN